MCARVSVQEMNVDVRGVDPDDAFSSVPYEKGFNFLFYLESLLGEEAMNGLLKAHCEVTCISCFFFVVEGVG